MQTLGEEIGGRFTVLETTMKELVQKVRDLEEHAEYMDTGTNEQTNERVKALEKQMADSVELLERQEREIRRQNVVMTGFNEDITASQLYNSTSKKCFKRSYS